MSSLILRRLATAESHLGSVVVRNFNALAERLRTAVDMATLSSWLTGIWSAVAPLGSSQGWRRALDGALGMLIMGGVVVVPVAAVIAVAGIWMPARTPLHQMAGQLFAFAITWFMLALFCAHFQPRHRDEETAS